MFSSGGSAGDKSTSKLTLVVARINFLAAVELRVLVSCWSLIGGHAQLTEAALSSLTLGLLT